MKNTHFHKTSLCCLLLAVLLFLIPGSSSATAAETALPSSSADIAEVTATPSPSATESITYEEAASQYLLILSQMLELQADSLATTSPEPMDKDEAYYQYLLLRAEMLEAYGEYASWSLEHRAELDQFRVDNGLVDETDNAVYDLPTPDEIPKDEALELARETVRTEFELEERSSIQWLISSSFYRRGDDGIWSVALQPSVPSSDGMYYAYNVEIDAKTGDAIYFAATEPSSESPEEEPEPEEMPDEPGENDISMEEALTIGQEAIQELMSQNERWSTEFLSLYTTAVAFSKDFTFEDGSLADVWILTYTCSDPVVDAYFGSCQVVLDAGTEEVLLGELIENEQNP